MRLKLEYDLEEVKLKSVINLKRRIENNENKILTRYSTVFEME